MSEQVAVFTYGRHGNPSVLKERFVTLFQRFIIAISFLFFLFVHPVYYFPYLLCFTLSLPLISLLDHYPPALARIDRSRVDLQLSGHTHNGQVFPLNLVITPLEYEFAYGAKAKRNTLFIVSSGLHYSSPPINTQGFSEILYIKAVFRSHIRTPKLAGE
jgi:hypothetical protein